MTTNQQPTVLLLGGAGFLGGFVKKALEDHGFSVRVLRRNAVNDDEVSGDVSQIHACNWERYLKDVHAVVNLSGIMRETGINTFEGVHVKGPSNLLNVCRAKNIRFVQVSALGSPDDGPFVSSKHAFDDILLTTYAENSVIFRPSVVCSPKGAYGGTELLRALSAFPLFLPLPDRGQFLFQPIDADDLGLILARACLSDKTGVYELGQKDPITLKEYLLAWRKWMGLPSKMMLRVPQFLISLSVFLSEYFLKGPLTRVVWADALFTAPAVFVQLITGLLMARVLHMPLSIFWIKSSLFLFFVTGLCWVLVLFLQMRARNLAQKALLEKTPLPENYYRTMRLWFVLGWPAFLSVLAIFFLMVHKPVL